MAGFRLDLIGFLCSFAALREEQKRSPAKGKGAKAQSREGKYDRIVTPVPARIG
jgi:hypothetical protein